jgi:hypothetical protein
MWSTNSSEMGLDHYTSCHPQIATYILQLAIRYYFVPQSLVLSYGLRLSAGETAVYFFFRGRERRRMLTLRMLAIFCDI